MKHQTDSNILTYSNDFSSSMHLTRWFALLHGLEIRSQTLNYASLELEQYLEVDD
jgi:hypothetical protein